MVLIIIKQSFDLTILPQHLIRVIRQGIRHVISCIFRQLLVLQNVVNIKSKMDITPQDLPVSVVTPLDPHSGIDPYHISCGIRDAGDVDHPQRIGEINCLEYAYPFGRCPSTGRLILTSLECSLLGCIHRTDLPYIDA